MSVPSGWYHDPSDPSLWRYWDGGSWTVHTAPSRMLPYPPPTPPTPSVQTYEVWAWIATLLCWGSTPFGIVALVYIYRAKAAFRAWDVAEGLQSLRTAKVWLWVALVAGLLWLVALPFILIILGASS